jgi:adenosylcobinamide kinase / adenosylcobinamide-phosphate guanylyltransferase
MGKLTFILGGARSGKSSYAQRLAERRGGPITYLATATPSDEEMAMRIAKHRRDRPAGWDVREIPHRLGSTLAAQPISQGIVLLDCLTILVANVTLIGENDVDHPDEVAAAQRVEDEIDGLLQTIQESEAEWIVVSNEVGQGLVPPYPLGRLYRDLLGRANQRLAAQAEEVVWMVAGIPVPIQGFKE